MAVGGAFSLTLYANSLTRKHVLNDLRPYLCTYPECATADQSYASRAALLYHEVMVHEQEREFAVVAHELPSIASIVKPESEKINQGDYIACLFCRASLSKPKGDERAQHVGRHMEEIAFSVVTKPYEDWDFYTDSSGKSNKDVDLNHTHQDIPVSDNAPFAYPLPERTSSYESQIWERTNPSIGKPCNRVGTKQSELFGHGYAIENYRKPKYRYLTCPKEKPFARFHALTNHIRDVHPNYP